MKEYCVTHRWQIWLDIQVSATCDESAELAAREKFPDGFEMRLRTFLDSETKGLEITYSLEEDVSPDVQEESW